MTLTLKFLAENEPETLCHTIKKDIMHESCLKPPGVTVMILTFRTDRLGQTVQTQIRLLCLQFRLHLLGALLFGKTFCSKFRMITANFWGVRILRSFTVHEISLHWSFMPKSCWARKKIDRNSREGVNILDIDL